MLERAVPRAREETQYVRQVDMEASERPLCAVGAWVASAVQGLRPDGWSRALDIRDEGRLVRFCASAGVLPLGELVCRVPRRRRAGGRARCWRHMNASSPPVADDAPSVFEVPYKLSRLHVGEARADEAHGSRAA